MATTPATAAKPKVNTVSLKHLAASLAESHEMPKKQGEAILNDLVSLVTKHLKKGDRIRLVFVEVHQGFPEGDIEVHGTGGRAGGFEFFF